MKKISFRIIFPILALPLFLFSAIITGGGHGYFMLAFLFFLPAMLIAFQFYLFLDKLNLFSIARLMQIVLIIWFVISLYWFYLIGTTIDYFLGKLAWRKAKVRILIQLFIVIISFIIFGYRLLSSDNYMLDQMLDHPHFFRNDYWIVWGFIFSTP